MLGLLRVFYELAYLMPAPVIGFLSGGNVPAGVLNYTADFASPIRMAWFAVILPALIVLEAAVLVPGRWSRLTRTAEIMLLVLAGTQLGWHASYGNIFLRVGVPMVDRVSPGPGPLPREGPAPGSGTPPAGAGSGRASATDWRRPRDGRTGAPARRRPGRSSDATTAWRAAPADVAPDRCGRP